MDELFSSNMCVCVCVDACRMLKERIAELEYSLNQQKDLTTKMRHWLDVADDDVALLRSENTILKKKVKA